MSDLLKISKRLFEEDLQRSDVNAIFKAAETVPKNWLGKAPESRDTLITRWKDARFPTDSRDIVSILKNAGYGDRAINKVFKKAGYGDSEDIAVSPAIETLSKYIIQSGYTDDILAFMKSEFPEVAKSYVREGTLAVEDIRSIFAEITNEDATELPEILKQKQMQNLGRNKK